MKNSKWRTILSAVLFCICCAFVLIVFSLVTKDLVKPWSDLVLGTIACIATFLITVVFAKFGKIQLNDLGIIPHIKSPNKFLLGFLIGLLLATIHVFIVLSVTNCKTILTKDLSTTQIITMLFLYSVLALREELAFRGYPLRVLHWKIGPWQSQMIIAVIFALEHLAGGYTVAQAFLGAGLGAVLFGMAAIKTNGIALPTGLHLAWNFGQWFFGFKNEPGIWLVEVKDKSHFEQITLLVYIVIFSLAIGGFFLKRTVHNRN